MYSVTTMVGRLATEPELKYTPGGHAVTTFRLAVDRKRGKDAQGQRITDFHDIVCWRQTAEFAANYLNKGRLVLVEGEYQIRPWVGQDGQKRKSYELVADEVKALDSPKNSNGTNGHGTIAPGVAETEPVGVGVSYGPEAGPGEFDDPFADQGG